MMKLKLQYVGHLMGRADSFVKILMLGKIEGRSRRGTQRMRWLDCISNSMDMGLGGLGSWWTGRPGVLSSWSCKELDTTEWLNWIELCYWRKQASLTIRVRLSMGLSLGWELQGLGPEMCVQAFTRKIPVTLFYYWSRLEEKCWRGILWPTLVSGWGSS